MRSRPCKDYESARERLSERRLHAVLLTDTSKPRRIVFWDGVRLLRGTESKHRTPAARRWRRLLRIKARFA